MGWWGLGTLCAASVVLACAVLGGATSSDPALLFTKHEQAPLSSLLMTQSQQAGQWPPEYTLYDRDPLHRAHRRPDEDDEDDDNDDDEYDEDGDSEGGEETSAILDAQSQLPQQAEDRMGEELAQEEEEEKRRKEESRKHRHDGVEVVPNGTEDAVNDPIAAPLLHWLHISPKGKTPHNTVWVHNNNTLGSKLAITQEEDDKPGTAWRLHTRCLV